MRQLKSENKEIVEHLGSKWKFWITLNNEKYLFKIGRENTLENQAEVIAYELSSLINLPCAEYDFATLQGEGDDKKIFGTISKNLKIESAESLVLGNQILEKNERYQKGERAPNTYTIELVLREMKEYLSDFVGYLVFDAFVGNTDRHHENWGIIENGSKRLAPSFDYGSAGFVRVSEKEAQERLNTKDKGRTLESFCQKARTHFYKNNKKLTTFEVVREMYNFAGIKEKLDGWIDKIVGIKQTDIEQIVGKIPKEFELGECQREFIVKFLMNNQKELQKIKEKHA